MKCLISKKCFTIILCILCSLIIMCDTKKTPVKYIPDSGTKYEDKIIFTSFKSDTFNVMCVNIDGSSPLLLTNDANINLDPQCSNDGQEILYKSERTLYIQQIIVMNNDGSNSHIITDDTLQIKLAKWSSNNETIAFTAFENQNYAVKNIYTINHNGQNLKKLTNGMYVHGLDRFDWSADGKKIVYSTISSSGYEINILDIDSLINTIITNPTEKPLGNPIWSTDDKYIVCEEYTEVGSALVNSDIVRFDVNGQNKITLTNGDGKIRWHTISPDGKKVAFSTDRDGNYEIYTINIDGSSLKRLTNNNIPDTRPIWSPGSDKIVFSSEQSNNNWQIYIMDSDGSNELLITASLEEWSNNAYSWMRIVQNNGL